MVLVYGNRHYLWDTLSNRGQFFLFKKFEGRWNLFTELANKWVISTLLFLSLSIASLHREARAFSRRLSKPLRYLSKFLAVAAHKLYPKGPRVCLSQKNGMNISFCPFLRQQKPVTYSTVLVEHWLCWGSTGSGSVVG
jgi:hypothetical protein